MDCSSCHASGARSDTQPSSGWAAHPLLIKDYKLNILKLHDDRQSGDQTYTAALAASGYSGAGLYATVTANGKPVLCAVCHGSNALGTAGQPGVAPLTQSVHGYHAHVTDPATGQTLDDAQNRSACYRCHPGSETRCLRGAMGDAVAADGTMAVQCQNCHGNMSAVGSERQGWLDEPNCQACHTGTAAKNSGQLRFTSALDASGTCARPRTAASPPTRTLPPPAFRSTGFRKATAACSARPATARRTPSSPVRTRAITYRAAGCKGMQEHWPSAEPATRPRSQPPAGRTGCTPPARLGCRRIRTPPSAALQDARAATARITAAPCSRASRRTAR